MMQHSQKLLGDVPACLSEGMDNVMKKTLVVFESRLVLGRQHEFGTKPPSYI
jgi:hypothetical protein